MADRSAASGNFGMDFQTNAGIVIMLDYIKDMKSIKLEGNYEDIDIELSDGNHILAQAKSVVDATNDFKNVRGNLKKALLTLSEGESKVKNKTTRLIYITNSPNPFNDDESKPIFSYLPSIRPYRSIPESSRKLIDGYLADILVPLNTDKLYIQTFSFETDEDREKYKYIYQKIRDFIEALPNTSRIPGLWKNTFTIWNYSVFKNGTRKNKDLTLKKENIIWPLIVIAVDREEPKDEFYSEFDYDVISEVTQLYSEVIDYFTSRFNFFSKVLCDYNNYVYDGIPLEKTNNFIKSCYGSYLDITDGLKLDDDQKAALVQTILYKIIIKRRMIDELKNEVNL